MRHSRNSAAFSAYSPCPFFLFYIALGAAHALRLLKLVSALFILTRKGNTDSKIVHSYGMGGQKSNGCIICDGQNVTVGAELNEALRRIRDEDEERVLWVDALCINQLDINERNQHVQRMGEIYAKADRVLIWLGEYIGCAYETLETLNALHQKIVDFQEEAKFLARGAIRAKFLTDPEIQHLRWDLLSDLLNRAWFERVWVLQEVVNSRKATIYCTNCQYPWDTFTSILGWLRGNDVDSPLYAKGELNSIETILMIMRLSGSKRDSVEQPLPKLLSVLQDSRACKSTLPIDKIYGVLGLVSSEEASKIEVDYNLDAAELFTRVATSELSKERGLEILYLCNKSAKKSAVKAPSWVPDWTQSCHHDTLVGLKYDCAAAGISTPNFRIQHRVLISRGRILDSIQSVELLRKIPKGGKVSEYSPELLKGETFWEQPELKFNEYFENATVIGREWVTNAISIAFPGKTITKEAHENLWRTFCCNRTDDKKIPPYDWSEYFSAWVTWMTRPEEKMSKMNGRQAHEMSLRSTRFMNSFGVWCYNRRFFRSNQGRFGWAPDQARPGDKLCILNGLAVPLILRAKDSGRFEIIGDAYVHGIMDGEVVDMDLDELDIHIV